MVSGQLGGLLTNQPLLPKITIQNLALGGVYTYDPTAGTNPPATGTYDFRLKSLSFTPPSDYGVSGTFDMVIHSPVDSAFLQNIGQYAEVTIWLGKTAASLTKIFLGSIEHIVIEEPTQNELYIHITGPDWGSQILQNRVINKGWYQLKIPGSDAVDQNDKSTDVGQIVQDILQNQNCYPAAGAPTIAAQGVVVNPANILVNGSAGISLPSYLANYEFVNDKLNDLDSYINGCHYVDPNKNFIMKFLPIDQSLIPDSGVLLTDDYNDPVAQGWQAGKVGLIKPGTKYDLTSEMHKSYVFGIQANQMALDQSQQDTSGGSDSVYSQYLAVKFVPTKDNLDQISVYVAKVGTLTNPGDCVLSITYDNNGAPGGQTISSPTISTDSFLIGETNHWHTALAGAQLLIKQPYWLILNKQGADSSHTYQWYKGGSGQTIATSPDGTNWTVTTNTVGYCFETWSSSPQVMPYQNYLDTNPNWRKNDYAESVIRKPFINTYNTMNWLLAQESYTLFRYKEMFSCTVFAPDTLLVPNQKVRIRKQLSKYKFDANYVLSTITYDFQADDRGAIGSFTYDITGTLYSTGSAGQTSGAS